MAAIANFEPAATRLARFAALRRALTQAESVDAIAERTLAFVQTALGVRSAALYASTREDEDFALIASAGDADLPPSLDRTSPFIVELGASKGDLSKTRELGSMWGVDRAIPAWQGDNLVGVLFVTGELELEIVDELQFELERALTVSIVAMLREEELAVLAIQERELVGLLREVQERDALMRADLEKARDFQRQMLGAVPRVAGAEVAVTFEPLELVGGDLYAVAALDGLLRVFVADATGHGVRACLTTMFIKSEYEIVRSSAAAPSSLLAQLNDAIAKKYQSAEMLFSAVCADIDLATGATRLAFAGHPPACVVRAGAAAMIGGGGPLMGLRPRMRFELVELHLDTDDGLYLFTDGFVEARATSGEQFGDDRARDAIEAAHRAHADVGAALKSASEAFVGGAKASDDATVVSVRRISPEEQAPPSLAPASAR